MKFASKLLMLVLVLLIVFPIVESASATKQIPTWCYLGVPAYGTYINFDSTRQFDTLYRSGNTWTIDDYGFSCQGSNMTINTLFEDTANVIEVTLSVPESGESVFVVDTSSIDSTLRPETTMPSEATSWVNVFSNGVNTITTSHTSEISYTLTYAVVAPSEPPSGGGPTVPSEPEEEEPEEPDTGFGLPSWFIGDEEDDGSTVFRTRVIIVVAVIVVIVAIVWYDRTHKR